MTENMQRAEQSAEAEGVARSEFIQKVVAEEVLKFEDTSMAQEAIDTDEPDFEVEGDVTLLVGRNERGTTLAKSEVSIDASVTAMSLEPTVQDQSQAKFK